MSSTTVLRKTCRIWIKRSHHLLSGYVTTILWYRASKRAGLPWLSSAYNRRVTRQYYFMKSLMITRVTRRAQGSIWASEISQTFLYSLKRWMLSTQTISRISGAKTRFNDRFKSKDKYSKANRDLRKSQSNPLINSRTTSQHRIQRDWSLLSWQKAATRRLSSEMYCWTISRRICLPRAFTCFRAIDAVNSWWCSICQSVKDANLITFFMSLS